MTTYRLLNLKGGTLPGLPPVGNVIARRVATAWSVHQQMAAQDRIIGSGRRTIHGRGLGPVTDCWIPDTNPDAAVANPVYPDPTTAYTVARISGVHWTPGSIPAMRILAIPSGATQKYVDVNNWDPDVPGGSVKVTIVLTNESAATKTITREVPIDASILQYNKKPQTSGKAWEVTIIDGALFDIDDFDNDPAVMAAWSGPYMTAVITVQRLGSPRVLDCSIYELPWGIARDITASNWPTHLYTEGGNPYQSYPQTFPVEAASASDPAIGFNHLIATAREQGFQLGPCLGFRSSWSDETATAMTVFNGDGDGDGDFYMDGNSSATGDDEAIPVTTTSTTSHHWLDSGWTTFEENLPGVPMGCGAYAREYRTSDQDLILPNNGVTEVIVGWYGNTTPAGGVVRFWVSAYSYVDIDISTSGDAWNFGSGVLECGLGPEDGKTCQLWTSVDAGTTMSTRYWGVWRPSNTSNV